MALSQENNVSESLLTIVATAVGRAKSQRQKIAFLELLITWLYDCAFAVKTFLRIPDIITFLLTLCHDQVILFQSFFLSQCQDSRDFPFLDGLPLLLFGVCMVCNDNTLEGHGSDAILQIIRLRIGVRQRCQFSTDSRYRKMTSSVVWKGLASQPRCLQHFRLLP